MKWCNFFLPPVHWDSPISFTTKQSPWSWANASDSVNNWSTIQRPRVTLEDKPIVNFYSEWLNNVYPSARRTINPNVRDRSRPMPIGFFFHSISATEVPILPSIVILATSYKTTYLNVYSSSCLRLALKVDESLLHVVQSDTQL